MAPTASTKMVTSSAMKASSLRSSGGCCIPEVHTRASAMRMRVPVPAACAHGLCQSSPQSVAMKNPLPMTLGMTELPRWPGTALRAAVAEASRRPEALSGSVHLVASLDAWSDSARAMMEVEHLTLQRSRNHRCCIPRPNVCRAFTRMPLPSVA